MLLYYPHSLMIPSEEPPKDRLDQAFWSANHFFLRMILLDTSGEIIAIRKQRCLIKIQIKLNFIHWTLRRSFEMASSTTLQQTLYKVEILLSCTSPRLAGAPATITSPTDGQFKRTFLKTFLLLSANSFLHAFCLANFFRPRNGPWTSEIIN